MPPAYDPGAASAYRRARTLPPEVLAAWDEAVATVASPVTGRVLDLGAGPAGFVPALRRWSGAAVVAAEPSAAMRAEGRDAVVPAPLYVGARAEELPFADGSLGWVWLSTVVHQIGDLDAATQEMARVVPTGGQVLVRGYLADVPLTGLLAALPGIERACASFPRTAAVVGSFERAGLRCERVVDVVEPWRFDVPAWIERVRSVRATDSLVRHLTDDELDAGLAAIADGAAGRTGPVESPLTLRLLVLSR